MRPDYRAVSLGTCSRPNLTSHSLCKVSKNRHRLERDLHQTLLCSVFTGSRRECNGTRVSAPCEQKAANAGNQSNLPAMSGIPYWQLQVHGAARWGNNLKINQRKNHTTATRKQLDRKKSNGWKLFQRQKTNPTAHLWLEAWRFLKRPLHCARPSAAALAFQSGRLSTCFWHGDSNARLFSIWRKFLIVGYFTIISNRTGIVINF